MLATVAPETIGAVPNPSRNRRRRRRAAWLIALAVGTPVALKTGSIVLGENFHTVVPGELYRSAQLSGSHLKRRVLSEGIRTVINLRGNNTGQRWYDDEVQACKELGVMHVDVRLSARATPPAPEMQTLLKTLHSAPRPILVHCANGADRSGLASTAFLMTEHAVPTDQAVSAQLRLWYGHLPIGPTCAMDEFFGEFQSSGDKSLAEWVNDSYQGKASEG